MRKSLLKLFLFLWVFLLGTINALAQATNGSCGASITWTYEPLTYTLTLTGSEETASYDVTHVSETTAGSPIQTDPRPYGWVAPVCKKIVVGEGITVLNKAVFDGFTALEEVKLPTSLKTIGLQAFRFSAIAKVTLPSSLETIGWAAFKFAQIGSIVLSANLKEIKGYAFQKSTIKNITLPENLNKVGYSVDTENDGNKIYGTSFAECDNLETVIVLAKTPFDLVSYQGNSNVNDALRANANLKIYVSKAEGVLNAYKAKSIKNSSNVEVSWSQTDIVNKISTFDAEGDCSAGNNGSVKFVVAGPADNKIVVIYGNGEMADYTSENKAPWNTDALRGQIKKVEFHDGVTRIGSHSFDGCTALNHIDFRPGNITIGSYAFKGCTSLTGVELMNGLKNIEAGAFQGCTSLGSITIPSSVTSIEGEAFGGCNALTEVVMEGNAPTIGNGVFPEGATINVSPTATGYDTGWSNVKTPVAQAINAGNHVAYYETLDGALDNVADGLTVKLLVDVTENISFNRTDATTGITLDLNDHIIAAKSTANEGTGRAIGITKGKLIITDNMASVPRYWKANASHYWEDPQTAIDGSHPEEYKTVGGCITGGYITSDGGAGISVTDNSASPILEFKGGNVVGNYANGRPGGGIYIGSNGSVTISDKAVVCGNAARWGGGIRIFGVTLNLNSGSKIYYNYCSANDNSGSGGGVSLHTGTLNLSGAVTIKDNMYNTTTSNLWFNDNLKANISGALTGSNIGVTMKTAGVFTSGYASHGGSTTDVTEIPSTGVFFLDGAYDDNYMIVDNNSGEAEIHKHSIGYTASANVLTAACSTQWSSYNCPFTAKNYTLTAQGGTYNGSAYTASQQGGEAELPEYEGWTKDTSINYYKTDTENATTDGTEQTSAPVNAGYYYAKYSVQPTSGNAVSAVKAFTIAKKDVTVSGITASNKTYDGTTTATLDCAGATLTGKIGSDALSVTATGTFDTANVGTGKTVTISDLTLGGESVGNYKLAAEGQQPSTTANITAKPVTVKAKDQSVTYGTAISNDVTYAELEGAIGVHTLSTVTLATVAAANTTGAKKTIKPTAATIKASSTDDTDVTSNYSITYEVTNVGTLTETVTVTPTTAWSTYYWDAAEADRSTAYLTTVDGLTPYTVTGVTTSVTTQAETYIRANTPYLLHLTTEGEKTLTVSYNQNITGTPHNGFKYANTAVPCDNNTYQFYILKNGEFVWAKSGTIPVGKCYIDLGSGSSARLHTLGINTGDGTTLISDKTILDASDNEGWYDMSGRKLQGKPAKKGVYVKNGKKVVIK